MKINTVTLYNELVVYMGHCRSASHPSIHVRRIHPNCTIVAYQGTEHAVGRGPFNYSGIWYVVWHAAIAFHFKLHENKRHSRI